jgi:Zn finger protein HypA/HybF involved in hydrogenase expression
MHEEALLRDLRRKLVEIGAAEPGTRITRVRVWVGALSHVHADQLRARWPETVDGTPADGSRLEVDGSNDATDPRASEVVLAEVGVETPGR